MNDLIYSLATWLIPLTIAIVFHEVAHGWVARAFGDPTAASLGRLSLNPIKHVDPFGTLILPMILALTGAPVFGWAKPVPVNPARLRNPRWHIVLVAAAGPLSNILLAFLAILLAIGVVSPWLSDGNEPGWVGFVLQNLRNFIGINLFLAVFNMIPLPPFDGSKVLGGFLPDGLRHKWESLDRYALLFMIGLLVILPQLGKGFDVIGKLVVPPVTWLMGALVGLAGLLL